MAEQEDKLHQQPTLVEVFKATKSMSFCWKEIGRDLGIPLSVREQLRKEVEYDDEDRLEHVLDFWLQNQGSAATWSSLIGSLISDNFIAI